MAQLRCRVTDNRQCETNGDQGDVHILMMDMLSETQMYYLIILGLGVWIFFNMCECWCVCANLEGEQKTLLKPLNNGLRFFSNPSRILTRFNGDLQRTFYPLKYGDNLALELL